MMHAKSIYALIALAAVGLAAAAPSLAETRVGASGAVAISAVSRPSGDVVLSFSRPGIVSEVSVKEGDPVKAGQVVARLDDAVEQAALKIAKAKADDELKIAGEVAYRDHKRYEFEKMKHNVGASPAEVRSAELEVVIGDARVNIEKFNKQQARLEYEQALVTIDKMQVRSPIDGVVAQAVIKVGENADQQNMKVMRIVQVDPLWVEVPVPIKQARSLKKGDTARVLFSDEKARNGAVALVFPVGDSGSETINVRVEVPNPEKLQPGENVLVTFPGTGIAAADPAPAAGR